MTKNEFFAAIVAEESIAQELRDYAQSALDKDAEAKKKRASKPSKAQIENAPLYPIVMNHIVSIGGVLTAAEIGSLMDVSTSKASSLLRKLEGEGKLVATECKGKSGKVKGYFLNPEWAEEAPSDEA